MADRFYVNYPLEPGVVTLAGAEAHHLTTVRRFRPGDPVCLFNGDGHEYAAEVRAVGRREVSLEVLRVESPQREIPFRVEVAAPVPKGDRAQFLIEKLTELGVARFVPLQTARSVVHPREGRLDRLQRYVIEASKQCGRNVLMEVQPMEEWAAYSRRADLPATRRVAHPGSSTANGSAEQDTALAVGPEGGFTEEEILLARESGWTVVDLGPRVLRVETAALVLAAPFSRPSRTGG